MFGWVTDGCPASSHSLLGLTHSLWKDTHFKDDPAAHTGSIVFPHCDSHYCRLVSAVVCRYIPVAMIEPRLPQCIVQRAPWLLGVATALYLLFTELHTHLYTPCHKCECQQNLPWQNPEHLWWCWLASQLQHMTNVAKTWNGMGHWRDVPSCPINKTRYINWECTVASFPGEHLCEVVSCFYTIQETTWKLCYQVHKDNTDKLITSAT